MFWFFGHPTIRSLGCWVFAEHALNSNATVPTSKGQLNIAGVLCVAVTIVPWYTRSSGSLCSLLAHSSHFVARKSCSCVSRTDVEGRSSHGFGIFNQIQYV